MEIILCTCLYAEVGESNGCYVASFGWVEGRVEDFDWLAYLRSIVGGLNIVE